MNRMERPEKIDTFMHMLMEEARRNDFKELCEIWEISEDEMYDCTSYIEETLEVCLY